ncbi:MAG TPA: ribonuclease III [Alphaproteobacteria bacterium]|nr:ribonuclease III [Alphaproteobacteria bacterium]
MSSGGQSVDRDLEGLERTLGHRFADRALLQAALRHSSLAPGTKTRKQGDHFERLEFLGDRVVGLAVADLLLARFPRESEGDLARRHAALVSRGTLAELAEQIELGAQLHLTRGEDETGGRTKPTVLADALEALVGAIYRDGGLEPARAFVARLYETKLGDSGRPPRDPKTALQEWAQSKGLPLPTYRILRTEGPPHQPRFQVEVSVKGREPVIAQGASKQAAERAAAAALLQAIEKR